MLFERRLRHRTEVYCPVCQTWTTAYRWPGRGRTLVLCDECDTALNDDEFPIPDPQGDADDRQTQT